jgi:hypothetical protein
MTYDTHGAWWWRVTVRRLEQDVGDLDTSIAQLVRRRNRLLAELHSAYEASERASGVPYIPHAEPDEYEAEQGGVVVEFRPKGIQ